jgi:hypothetical protein
MAMVRPIPPAEPHAGLKAIFSPLLVMPYTIWFVIGGAGLFAMVELLVLLASPFTYLVIRANYRAELERYQARLAAWRRAYLDSHHRTYERQLAAGMDPAQALDYANRVYPEAAI